jgi:hypothetical protein
MAIFQSTPSMSCPVKSLSFLVPCTSIVAGGWSWSKEKTKALQVTQGTVTAKTA